MRIIDRFDEYLLYKHLNDNKVTIQLGLTNGVIGKSRKEGRDLSQRVIEQIEKYYTDLNINWLLTGEGEMLKGESRSAEDLQGSQASTAHCVPVLPLAAQAGKLSDYSEGITRNDCEYAVSPIAGADMIIPVLGESMAPEYGNGSRVIVKKIDDKAFIEWGKVYVLDTVNGIVMKEIHKGDTETELVCHSLNPDPKYAEFTVQRSDILGMYRVLMCMTLK